MEKQKYFYIYNLEQADFFVANGLQVLSIGKGSRGDVFVKFARNEKGEKVFNRWVNRNK